MQPTHSLPRRTALAIAAAAASLTLALTVSLAAGLGTLAPVGAGASPGGLPDTTRANIPPEALDRTPAAAAALTRKYGGPAAQTLPTQREVSERSEHTERDSRVRERWAFEDGRTAVSGPGSTRDQHNEVHDD